MATFNPYDQYLNVQFGTVDQGTLIIMTFDGSIRFLNAARDCLEEGDNIGKGDWLAQAFETVAELRKSLRPEEGADLVNQLSETYGYVCNQITMANVFSKVEHIDNALVVLDKLREAWKHIIQEQRQEVASNSLIG